MKQLNHFFKEAEINFFISSHDKDVIANASEMAISFNKIPSDFLKLKETENFINLLLERLNEDNEFISYNKSDIAFTKDGSTYMHRKLALKFAFWLNDEFEIWFFEIVDDILFGNYKKHWDAHVIQKSSQLKMQELKQKLLLKSPTKEDVHAYFTAEREFVNARMTKLRAIKDQYSFDFN
jgi:hypothetical protein